MNISFQLNTPFALSPHPMQIEKKRKRQEDKILLNTRAEKQQKIEKTHVLVYHDVGTCQQSTEAIIFQLKQNLPKLKIKLVSSDYLRSKSWENKSVALVMGGGICSEWENSLQLGGMCKIKNFVSRGGKYLGICAGAYFAASHSIFSLLGRPAIEKNRSLQFYSGKAAGPILVTDDHLSPQAALATKIELVAKSGLCYYQGGCYFDINEDSHDTKVIGKYSFPYTGAAIISCKVGTGIAVLCGPHPEFAWNQQFTERVTQPQLYDLAQQLAAQENFRQQIWETMIQELSC